MRAPHKKAGVNTDPGPRRQTISYVLDDLTNWNDTSAGQGKA